MTVCHELQASELTIVYSDTSDVTVMICLNVTDSAPQSSQLDLLHQYHQEPHDNTKDGQAGKTKCSSLDKINCEIALGKFTSD